MRDFASPSMGTLGTNVAILALVPPELPLWQPCRLPKLQSVPRFTASAIQPPFPILTVSRHRWNFFQNEWNSIGRPDLWELL